MTNSGLQTRFDSPTREPGFPGCDVGRFTLARRKSCAVAGPVSIPSATLLVVCTLTLATGCQQEPTSNLPAEQAQAIKALEALGATATIREERVTFIDFYSTRDTAAAVVHLDPFVDLKKLNFSSTHVTDDELAHVTHLVNLEELALNNTPVTDAGLAHLAGLTKLQVLNLDDTVVSDAGLVHLAGLTELERLHLNKTQITDAGLEHFAGLENLEHLLLYGTPVTPAGAQQLRELRPDLNIVVSDNAEGQNAEEAEAPIADETQDP